MKKISIAKTDISEFVCLIPDFATECEKYAAEEFVRYIKSSCGTELEIKKESEISTKNIICIGRCLKTAKAINLTKYGEEGFIITVFDGRLYIAGNEKRGTLYGVYTFLENYIGWRFLTEDTEILKEGDIDLEEGLFEEQFPSMEWRDVCIPAYLPIDIAVKRKINSSYRRNFPEHMGGSFLYPGRFVHTMESLLGVPQHQQPCFSDEENLKKCIVSVRKLLEENPETRIISVTQNDNNLGEDNFCTCDRCRKIDEEEGSHAGSLLRFVNAVADAIKDDYPKVSIMTLAYLHTTDCPKITIPRDNVIIEFAPMTLCYNHGVDDMSCKINSKLLSDFRDWGRITNRIYIWDYCANFSFTVPHFPDFQVLRRNVHYYSFHNVCGMFCEGDNYVDNNTTDLSELRAYLLSKLLWEPDMSEKDFMRHMDDFLEGYYGKGGRYIKKYLKLLEGAIKDPDRHIFCYQNPMMLLSNQYMLDHDDEMFELWNKAEKASSDNESAAEHLRRSRLGYTYLRLLYTFDERMKTANEEGKKPLIAENKAFYEALKHYNIQPRGWQSKLPEMTDFTQSAGIKIYW